jgi:choline dehydrogenase-like flavoprotein
MRSNIHDKHYQFIIVGSGAGGATIAKELSSRGKHVLVIERGNNRQNDIHSGTRLGNLNIQKIQEALANWRAEPTVYSVKGEGGATYFSHGNGIRCLEEEFAQFGINLDAEFNEAEDEMGIAPLPERFLSEATRKILTASSELGYHMQPMPKFINPEKCSGCGNCTQGCSNDAKWTALDYLKQAIRSGASVMYDTKIEQISITNGRIRGVTGKDSTGQIEISSDAVILAAGGLGTPVILQRSGITEAGSNLFVDLIVDTYGVTKDINQLQEPPTALIDLEFHRTKGFILSPFVSKSRLNRFIKFGSKSIAFPFNRAIGIMTKISDDPTGFVSTDGTIRKPVSQKDRQRLNEGSAIAKQILLRAGAQPASIMVSKPHGAHPGGTAAIGRVVDKNLETRTKNLFVCDASVLPTAPGLPPILTIVALAKHLARTLAP